MDLISLIAFLQIFKKMFKTLYFLAYVETANKYLLPPVVGIDGCLIDATVVLAAGLKWLDLFGINRYVKV